MRPLKTRLTHIGRFSAVELDLTQLPENALLVAYDGEPGAGKSTLFRSLTWGALFRKFKNSGSLKDLASGPDASLETTTEYGGKRYTIKHLVSGKDGASQLTCDQSLSHDRAKRKDFKKAIEDTFPSELLLSNTVWRDQKSMGFLELEQSERRELILLATGATQWQKWFTAANASANGHADNLKSVAAKIAVLGESFSQEEFDERENRLCQLQGELVLANEAVGIATRVYDLAREQVTKWERSNDAYHAYRRAEAELRTRISAGNARLELLDCHKVQLDSLISNADAIRKAFTTANLNHDEQEKSASKLTELRLQVQLEERGQHEIQRRLDELQGICSKIEETESRVASCRQAAVMVEELQKIIETKEGAIRFAEVGIENKRKRLTGNKDIRIAELRSSLQIVAEGKGIEHVSVSLALDDQRALDESIIPREITDLIAGLSEHREALNAQRKELAKGQEVASRLQYAIQELDRLTEMKLQRETLESKRIAATEKLKALDAQYNEEHAVYDRLREDMLALTPLTSQMDALIGAEASLKANREEYEHISRRLADERLLEPVPEPGAKPELDNDSRRLDIAKLELRDRQFALDNHKFRIQTLEDTHKRIAELTTIRNQHAREEADWRKLANLISRDGIQGALVDAAGPELSKTVNHFLHTCFGNRWSQTISTQRDSADGKKTIEQCKVWVVDQGSEEDNAPAREGEGITFSGGEQEILSLAFQLALTHLARNSGIVEPDIYLDEPASSLNESMRAKWVHMLRVAAGLIGCKHIHFISHNEDVKRLADARVRVAKGTATIVQGDSNGQ